jgi:hypothetical protein
MAGLAQTDGARAIGCQQPLPFFKTIPSEATLCVIRFTQMFFPDR